MLLHATECDWPARPLLSEARAGQSLLPPAHASALLGVADMGPQLLTRLPACSPPAEHSGHAAAMWVSHWDSRFSNLA